MGGFFGVAASGDCVSDLFFGTDYHSHLGTRRGGMAVCNHAGIKRFIHDITNTQFRSKFERDVTRLHGRAGVGVISDIEDQPLIIASHLGTYSIVTVGRVSNIDKLAQRAFSKRTTHFSEMGGGCINPTEMVATLINQGSNFADGIHNAQESIEGSCSMMLLTEGGLYVARDRVGRTPVVLGRKPGARAVTMETCAFPNLDYEIERFLGPGEIVRVTADGVETLQPPGSELRMCAFLWIYYGFPASSYEGINVEQVRYRCGAALARADQTPVDLVAGIPDSGVGHALGYASERHIPYERPFVKYTPTWSRSFIPQDPSVRELAAKMKLIPIREIISGRRLLFCEDSIVRGTQLRETIRRLFDVGAREVHMRAACPPLLFACPFLNFSRSRSELDLAGRRAAAEIEGGDGRNLAAYAQTGSACQLAMIDSVRKQLSLTSLRYQTLDDMIAAIGLPREHLCTFCWTGRE